MVQWTSARCVGLVSCCGQDSYRAKIPQQPTDTYHTSLNTIRGKGGHLCEYYWYIYNSNQMLLVGNKNFLNFSTDKFNLQNGYQQLQGIHSMSMAYLFR